MGYVIFGRGAFVLHWEIVQCSCKALAGPWRLLQMSCRADRCSACITLLTGLPAGQQDGNSSLQLPHAISACLISHSII